jgi:hypothetical protein
MQIFLLDLWHDLREKRLAPVAVALLVGLVAVPLVLAKPASDPAPAADPAASASAKPDKEELAALAKVTLGEEEVGKGSTLGVFDPDNPFNPPKGAMKKDDADDSLPGGGGDAGAPSGGGSTGSSGGGVDTGGGDINFNFGDAPGGDNTGGSDPGTGGGTQTTVYKFVVDITFEANGRTRRIKGLEKLDMLPNESSPLLIFMGVTAKGSDAVFLVDSTLEAAGEGRCKPSPSECAFAYIGAGSEYYFTEDDGDTYMVKVDEIRRVKVDTDGKSSGAKGAKARASVGPHRRFVPPVLADLVVVSDDTVQNSNSDSESR